MSVNMDFSASFCNLSLLVGHPMLWKPNVSVNQQNVECQTLNAFQFLASASGSVLWETGFYQELSRQLQDPEPKRSRGPRGLYQPPGPMYHPACHPPLMAAFFSSKPPVLKAKYVFHSNNARTTPFFKSRHPVSDRGSSTSSFLKCQLQTGLNFRVLGQDCNNLFSSGFQMKTQ